jgi:hypothetical protein
MSYPKVLKHNFFGDYYEEMTPEEYDAALSRYRDRLRELEQKPEKGTCDTAYFGYLKIWFSDRSCDGCGSYDERIRRHRLPMSQTNYWAG